jgi:hypothetical protein
MQVNYRPIYETPNLIQIMTHQEEVIKRMQTEEYSFVCDMFNCTRPCMHVMTITFKNDNTKFNVLVQGKEICKIYNKFNVPIPWHFPSEWIPKLNV